MISHTNYITVNKSCFAVQSEEIEAPEATMKEKIFSLVYPAIGVIGIIYQLLQVLTGK